MKQSRVLLSLASIFVLMAQSAFAAPPSVEAYVDGESSKIAIVIRGPTAKYIYGVLKGTPTPESPQKLWKYGTAIACLQDTTLQGAPASYTCSQLVD